ncbi:S8 family serine peptidase [Stenotrophomonas sp. C3(2023)]|uniref:S8 family serine peptidase n=1 Tax=Stenotrophomonas sp. C3(2023) TaxID=3080277 RepID=UPI00293C4310|nr:S8 family serine peptidase [Stenotrophomonas sp. C3(2023)]MDV3468094.1 S8 family serine peptidase [Stenotrophomonas sp. C3(2023)]
MNYQYRARTALAAALAMALSACGGGGGGGHVRSDPAPVTPPPPPPVTPPPTQTPPPLRVEPTQPGFDGHLRAINAVGTGVDGQGIRIGVVDSGVNRSAPALAGRVVANHAYIDPTRNNLAQDDVVGHGTAVASLAAGAPVGSWAGGVAPGARIVSARIIADTRPVDDGSGKGNEVSGALGLAGVHQDLIAAGAKIMNNSWGGLYWTNTAATAPIAAEYRPFIAGNGGLVVFATGNESKADPSSMAALPSQPGAGGTRPAADLERGWLAVTAVDTVQSTVLASYANACGVAASYCLAAPGSAVYPDPQGGSSYYWNSGTSFAAPLVSGAAALVWQKYPYLSNDQVRQTLLGTATDIGAPGVDAVFGHGLLNVGKAVQGPGRFDWGDMVVTVGQTGLDSVWGNAISGDGGLVKRGAGALGLSGANTYAGATRIERGTLALRDGGSIRSNVSIGANSDPSLAALQFMGGTPRVIGNVDNAGSVVLLSAATTGTIEGDYVQRAGAQLMLALGSNALQVTGTATLDGGVHINGRLPGYVPADGQRQALVTAGKGIVGTFATPATAGNGVTLLQSRYGYDSNAAWLELERVSVTAAVLQANDGARLLGSAQRVERAFEVLDADADLQGSAFGAAAGALQQVGGGVAGLGTSLDSLSGRAHALATAQVLDTIDMAQRGVAARFGQAVQHGGAWQMRLGEAGQGGFSGDLTRSDGWLAGQEQRLADGTVVGVAFGQTRTLGSDGSAGDNGRERQAQAQLYAGWQAGALYGLVQLGSGQFQRQLDRQLLLGSSMLGTSARYGGRFATASMEGGWRLGRADAGLTPYLGLSHTRVDTDAFTESGGLGFGLRGQASTVSRSVGTAGLRGHWQGARWALRGHAQWQQELAQQGSQLASFTALQDWAALPQERLSAAVFGISVEALVGRYGRLTLGHDQRLGGSPYQTRQTAVQYTHSW